MILKGFEKLNINLIEVILNNACPLNCSYCFLQSNKNLKKENITVNTLTQIFLFCKKIQEINRQPFITLIFALKEPLISWNEIQTAIDNLSFKLNDYNIGIALNTNGVLLTPQIIQYCQKHNIEIHISLDGPKDIHDRDRFFKNNNKSNYEQIKNIIENYPNNPIITYATTLHMKDQNRFQEIFHFMSNLPISGWVYNLDSNDKWNYSFLEKEIKKFINSASSQQLKKTRFATTAAQNPNLNVINALKIEQDGTVLLLPPIPNEKATKGEFKNRIEIGNIFNVIKIPFYYQNTDFSSYQIQNEEKECNINCNQYKYCKQGSKDKIIYIDDKSCNRIQHYKKIAEYAQGGKMTDQEYKKIISNKPIFNAVINVTDNCNLRCPYCFTEHNTRVIDMGTMKAAIMFILNQIDKFPNFNQPAGFNFFGGEPMLHFEDIIKPTILWTEEMGLREKYKINFGMTTNGTLLNEENLIWLKEHKVSILLSIDGDKETQDSQRPGINGSSSFDILESKLPLIIKYFPNTTFRSAIEPYNADKIFENYLFARKNNFLNYFITPNLEAKWSLEQIETALGQLSLIAEMIYRDVCQGMTPLNWGNLYSNIKDIFMNQEDKIHEVSFYHCGIGTSSIGIAVNGDLNGCQEHNTYLNHDIFYIGNVFTGIDIEKHKRLLSAYSEKKHPICKEKPELCNTCSFYNDCANHYCPSHNLLTGDSAIENNLVACLWKRFCRDLAYIILEQIQFEKNPKAIKFLEDMFIDDKFKNYSNW